MQNTINNTINDPIMGVHFGGGWQDDAATRMAEIQRIEEQKAQLASRQQDLMRRGQQSDTPIWDSTDAEMSLVSDKQRADMQRDKEYMEVNAELAEMVQTQMLYLVRGNIEQSPKGKELLSRMLEVTKRVKGAVLTAERAAMEEFEAFRIASAKNPELTMSEFRKSKKQAR